MDEFFQEQQLDLPTYVKIDVEGMESTILKTMDFIFLSYTSAQANAVHHPITTHNLVNMIHSLNPRRYAAKFN